MVARVVVARVVVAGVAVARVVVARVVACVRPTDVATVHPICAHVPAYITD